VDWIGIQLEKSNAKLARISRNKKKIILEELKEDNVKQLYFGAQSSPERPYGIISGLEEVLFKEVKLPTLQKSKVLKLLPFQIESHLPYPLEEAVLSVHLTSSRKEKETRISVFSAKISSLEEHQKLHFDNGINLDKVSCVIAGLSRFSSFFFGKSGTKLLLHVGKTRSIALCLEEGEILFSHTFPVGTSLVTEESETLAPDFDKINESNSQLRKEFKRIFLFLEKKLGPSCKEVLLTGDFSEIPKFIEFFSSGLPDSLTFLPLPTDEKYDSLTMQAYAVPIGLALEGISEDGKDLSFCVGPFLTDFMKEKRKKRFFSFALATTALSAVMLVMGSLQISQKKHGLLKRFSEAFMQEGKKVSSLHDLEKELVKLENGEKNGAKNYLLVPPIPSVTEVLAYLGSHPAFSVSKEIEIVKVSYNLVKYPKNPSPKDPYLGKVTLEISVPNGKTASSFHERFCKDNPLINEKKEIVWEEKGDFCSLSFFLRPYKGV